MNGPAEGPADNPPNSDRVGVYHRTVHELTISDHWDPWPPIWLKFGLDLEPDRKWQSGNVTDTTAVDIIVWSLSIVQPPWQHLPMPHGLGVDNCSLRFTRKGRQLNLRESRSPTEFLKRNQLPGSHRLWASVCTCTQGLLMILAMVMIAMVMVSVMVIIFPNAFAQVGWLRQH